MLTKRSNFGKDFGRFMHKGLKNKSIFFIGFFLFFRTMVFSFDASSSANTKVYVMLDVDGTLTQRIDPNDIKTIAQVEEAGFHCYRLKFITTEVSDPKFYHWYKSMLEDKKLRDEQKLNVRIVDSRTIEVEEVVVLRPAMVAFLEKLDHLNRPFLSVTFYVASRNDDVRNQNLMDHLNASINGVIFKNKIKLIPRADFRVHVYLKDEGLVAGKSAALIRAKYPKIESNAYIIFVDNIAPERFVVGDRDLDKLFRPTRFTISNLNKIDIEKDQVDFQSMFQAIKTLIIDFNN